MSTTTQNDPLVGLMYGDYIVVARLAHGGMGAVYLCRHRELDIRKVLKVVLPELVAELAASVDPVTRRRAELIAGQAVDRFEAEAKAVAKLNHANIAPIDSIGTIAGRRCILMPHLDGMSLHDLLGERGGRLSSHDTLHIATQIALALTHAHERGIVHRDLKPANVFIVPTDADPLSVRVIDFGIAKHVTGGTHTISGPLGTPSYMAVEQFQHANDATPLADLYALAIMIWQMVTGMLPWGVHDSAILYQLQLHHPPPPPPPDLLLPAWEEHLRSALKVPLEERPQSLRELIRPLALSLPGCAPFSPSGVDIVRALGEAAKRWLNSGPDDETVRNRASHTPRASWQVRDDSAEVPPLNVVTSSQLVTARRTAVMPTTLGSSAAVVTTPSARRRKHVVAGATALAVLVGIGVTMIVDRLGTEDAPDARSIPATSSRAPISAPDVAPSPPPSSPLPSVAVPVQAAQSATPPATQQMPTLPLDAGAEPALPTSPRPTVLVPRALQPAEARDASTPRIRTPRLQPDRARVEPGPVVPRKTDEEDFDIDEIGGLKDEE